MVSNGLHHGSSVELTFKQMQPAWCASLGWDLNSGKHMGCCLAADSSFVFAHPRQDPKSGLLC